MPALSVPHEEALARGLAVGLSQRMAGAEAGYARRWKHGRERAARPDIVTRARELRDAGETRDVTEMIGALMRLAGKAGEMRTAAAMVAARGLVAEAAKLNQRTLERRETLNEAPQIVPGFMPLSDEDWTAKYGQ